MGSSASANVNDNASVAGCLHVCQCVTRVHSQICEENSNSQQAHYHDEDKAPTKPTRTPESEAEFTSPELQLHVDVRVVEQSDNKDFIHSFAP